MRMRRWDWLRDRLPEFVLAFTACAVFLACLGSMEFWGKREQRAVAESIDTLDNGHWLVAEIQGRPRLEKPPLPRWISATLISATGVRSEWFMRLPNALAALGMVALTYALGNRIGGRAVGLAGAFALISIPFFVVEMRQAGNDGPLAFFVCLAIYCAWRRLHGSAAGSPPTAPGDHLGARGWARAMYAALGAGFLCKGPVAVLLVALSLVPYLAVCRRLRVGGRALVDGWGMLLFTGLMLSWPVPVLLSDRRALDVWLLEMGQKAGTAGITHHRWRGPLATEWPAMTAPWTVLASIAVIAPLFRRGRGWPQGIWLIWSWAVANLVMFCFWSVAKPNYYLPCMPAIALLAGVVWTRLVSAVSDSRRNRVTALRIVRGHWLAFAALAVAGSAFVTWKWPGFTVLAIAGAAVLLAGVAVSALVWSRGRPGEALAPLVVASSVLIVAAYGVIAPRFNSLNGHAVLADQIAQIVPPSTPTVYFYSELDEGLWYYLRGHKLTPVGQPRYNKSLDLLDDFKAKRIIWDDSERFKAEGQALAEWIKRHCEEPAYMLIKAKTFDIIRGQLDGMVTPLLREADLDRNELLLLRVHAKSEAAVAERESVRPDHSVR